MAVGVETGVEMNPACRAGHPTHVVLRLLGPLAISRDGAGLPLPRSRKVRALLAYLALAPRAVTRSQLCELLWDVPNDPRGELRWCLSKIRALVDDPDRHRVQTEGDTVWLDLDGCAVDALGVKDALSRLETSTEEELRSLAAAFAGDLLEGLEIDRSPAFESWLAAQRRFFRAGRIAVLERLVQRSPDAERLSHLETWLELAPLDCRVHQFLLEALAQEGRFGDGEEHLAATRRQLETEGLDAAPLVETWRRARGKPSRPALPLEAAAAIEGVSVSADAPSSRASIAVMPFAEFASVAPDPGGMAAALAHDVITRIAKLRSLVVIAQGSVFALHERRIDAGEAGRMLKVDYVVSGSVRRQGRRLAVMVELAETRTARILWAETFDHTVDDAFLVLDAIGNRIVASIAGEIETVERNRAILKPPNGLDAWEAHHRGLWHMYRFNKPDNALAAHFFQMAVRLDPTFSRAYAGLSFTHFQNAFQGWAPREEEIGRALAIADRSLAADDRDPAAHWATGRALWLHGRQDQAMGELEQAIDLSPNFALGHYTLAFVHSQAGDPHRAIVSADHSRHLSPFDPLLFAMLGARAMALLRLGRFDEAADYGVRAAARPNAHAHIAAIAAFSLALAGRDEEAKRHLARIHQAQPGYGIADFLAAMRFSTEGEALFRQAAERLGMD